MTTEIDPRIVKITIDLGNNKFKTYASPFQITAFGTKYANQLQNECYITIENLDRDTQNDILTASSPFNEDYSPKYVRLEAGRESYGTQIIFEGNIITSSLTNPPDIGISLQCLTGNYSKGSILARVQGGNVPLSTIAKQIANDLGVALQFEATDKTIPNYQYSGNALGQLSVVNSYGGINAFIDQGILVIKDGFIPLKNSLVEVSESAGMIGIPGFTEQGIRVRYLVDRSTILGGRLRLKSERYPTMDGDYVIYKLGFEITSREIPFYYIAECVRVRE